MVSVMKPTAHIAIYCLALSACGNLRPLSPKVRAALGTADGGNGTSGGGSIPGPDTCDPADPNEDQSGTGQTCDSSPVALGDLTDDGATLTVKGNLSSKADKDWFWVHAVDLPGDQARGWEDFRLDANITPAQGVFELRVLRHSCNNLDDICDGQGYDSYSWFVEDTEPDELGELPAVLRACGAENTDACEDWTGDYYIEVVRADGNNDCTEYTLELSNGVWPAR